MAEPTRCPTCGRAQAPTVEIIRLILDGETIATHLRRTKDED